MAFQRLDTMPLGIAEKRTQSLIRETLPKLISENALGQYGAFALGIGRKCKDGPVALRFYVQRKLPEGELAVNRRIPKTICIIDGSNAERELPTDVVERGLPSAAMQDPESRLRPVPGGVSISIPGSGGNGTLGAWVFDKTDETVVALTNRHVSGGVTGAQVIQPGSQDGGSPQTDRIGVVKRIVPFVPLPSNPTPADCNMVDAAIIGADDPDLIDLRVIDVGPGIYQIATSEIGDSVQKMGQTTGYQTGIIVDEDITVQYSSPVSPGNWEEFIFCDCYLIDDAPGTPLPGFIASGDSGAVLFGFSTDSDAAIQPATGLIFASTGGGGGYASKIQNVFTALDLDVLCSSGYPAYLDGLAQAASDANFATPPRFSDGERRSRAPSRNTAGLARDVERRLLQSEVGRSVVALVERYRHPILMRLIRHSDFRRAVTAALTPLLSGACTSDDIFSYKIDRDDLARLARVQKILKREGLNDIAKQIDALAFAQKKAVGKRLGDTLKIEDC